MAGGSTGTRRIDRAGTAGRRWSTGIALLAAGAGTILVAPGTATASSPDQGSIERKAKKVRAVVLGEAHSPLLRQLKRRPGFRVKRASKARRPGPRRHRMLIVDGDHVGPRKLRRHRLVHRYLEARRWVLALDLKTRHHKRAISHHTGFDAPKSRGRNEGRHFSRMFLFRRTLAGSGPKIPMVEARRLRPRGSHRLGKRQRRIGARRQARFLARYVMRRVKRKKGARERVAPGVTDAPPEALHIHYPFTEVGSHYPPLGYWHGARRDPDGLIKQPQPHLQTVNWTMNHSFDVYLENPPNPTQDDPNKQIVVYNLDGQVAPKYPNESFFQMYNIFTVADTTANLILERAWWNGILRVDVNPQPDTDAKIVWQGNEPRTENSETEYTSSEEFEVGVTVSKEGAEGEASYSVGKGQSQTIHDWGVESTTSRSHMHWDFSSRSPCDPRPNHYSESACFDLGLFKGATPKEPNALSLGQLTVNTQGRWATKKLLEEDDAALEFDVSTPLIQVDTYCQEWGVTDCASGARKINYTDVGPDSFTAKVDVSNVLPVPIKSLTFKPSCADGRPPGQDVTGVITLERPLPKLFEYVTVDVHSGSQNAVLQGGRNTTTQIAGGETQGTFKIKTNANDLNKPPFTSAAITVFYGDFVTEQLEIRNGPCPS